MNGYHTLVIRFVTPIADLNVLMREHYGASTLKEWIDGYESTRFIQTDSHTAVITSEYNMEYVKEWLRKHIPSIEEQTEY